MAKVVAIYKFRGIKERYVVPTHILDKIGTYYGINPKTISKRYFNRSSGATAKGYPVSYARKVYWKWMATEFGFTPTRISRIEGFDHNSVYTALDEFHLVEEDYKKIFDEKDNLRH